MSAIAVWTWVGAVVLAVVVLGFGAYEIVWKLRRLGRDVTNLQTVQADLARLQTNLQQTQRSLTTIRALRTPAQDPLPLLPQETSV